MSLNETLRAKGEGEERPKPTRLAVLISNKGTGTNLQAIIDAIERGEIDCEIGFVISDQSDAKGLNRAQKHKIPFGVRKLESYKSPSAREEYGKGLASFLNVNGVHVTVLAGFGTVLSPSYFDRFRGTTINIHPGLIPDEPDAPFKFPDGTDAPWNRGLMTERAVENFLGGKYAGSTIHIATPETDFGPVLERVIVEVKPEDTVDSLYNGRLKPAEHQGLIRVLKNPPRKGR